MPKALIIIFQVFGSIAFICFLGYFLGRGMEKHHAKKYEHDFRIMCLAVANEICSKTCYNYRDLLFNLDQYIRCCANYPDAEIDAELRKDYDEQNYRHFTYFTVLKHYPYDEVFREKVENYCKLHEAVDRRPTYERITGQFCGRKNDEPLAYYVAAIFVWGILFALLKLIFHF